MDETANLKDLLKKPVKASPLEQVKQDAQYNYLSRMKEQIELEKFKEAKSQGRDAVKDLSASMLEEVQRELGYETESEKMAKKTTSSKKG